MWLVFLLAITVVACSKDDALEVPTGSEVTVQKHDGVTVSGRLVEVKPEHVIVETNGVRTQLARGDIKSLQTTQLARTNGATSEPQRPRAATSPTPAANGGATGTMGAPSAEPASVPSSRANGDSAAADPTRSARYREMTIPAGTVLAVALSSAVASDTSHVEDAVRGTVRRAVRIDGVEAIPAGTAIAGNVVSAKQSARVKGRASVAFRFSQLDMPGEGGRVAIRTATVSRLAPATKKQDAAKIGAGAAGGAIIGGLIGGGDGAAKGAAVGGGAGTAVVMSTRGKEVRLGPGTPVSVRLTAPVTVRVPIR
jgi:hypothetical protein